MKFENTVTFHFISEENNDIFEFARLSIFFLGNEDLTANEYKSLSKAKVPDRY